MHAGAAFRLWNHLESFYNCLSYLWFPVFHQAYENYNVKSMNLFYLLSFIMVETNRIKSKNVTTLKKY